LNVAITSFNNGEVTPLIHERSDVEKYAASCRTLVNMLPTIYGAVTRRPGTEYIATAKFSPQPIRLVPFIYSSDTAYMCEFGPGYIRFYWQGAPLLDSTGKRVEVAAPYVADDLPQIQYRQVGDVLWLVHPNYPPAQLKRTSPITFTLTNIAFTGGPFMVRNDVRNNNGVTMTPSASAVGATGTLTASADTFQDAHAGALFQLTQTRSPLQVTLGITAAAPNPYAASAGTGISAPLYVQGTFTVSSAQTWTATVALQRSEDAAHAIWDDVETWTGANNLNIQYAGTENDANIQYRVVVSSYTSQSGGATVTLTLNSSVQIGVVRVDTVASATVANVTVVEALASTAATTRWAEGSWSGVRGYPTAVAFFQDRIIYGGTTAQPQTVWFSATDDYENFEEVGQQTDADAFEITMAATNRIRWIEGLDMVVVGTGADEWRITSGPFTTASGVSATITPTNFNVLAQTTYGGMPLMAVKTNLVALFADFVGRKVREMTYRLDQNRYVAPDLTAMAEHVTAGGIVSMALQRNPDVILWAFREDGTLLSMTYEREQNVVAWARHLSGPGGTAFGTAHTVTGIGQGNLGGLPGSSTGQSSPSVPPPPEGVPTSCPILSSGDWTTMISTGGPVNGLYLSYRISGYTDGLVNASVDDGAQTTNAAPLWDGLFTAVGTGDPGGSLCLWPIDSSAGVGIDTKSIKTWHYPQPAIPIGIQLYDKGGGYVVWRLQIICDDGSGEWVVVWEGEKSIGANPAGVYTKTAGGAILPASLTIEAVIP
jgi:hypothetical protein